MTNTIRSAVVAACGALIFGATAAPAQRASDRVQPAEMVAPSEQAMADASAEMARLAHNFWVSLSAEQQAKCTFSFDDTKERTNWHFIPRERKGITWNDMDSAQQKLAQALLASGLSSAGYEKAVTIMSLDAILKEMEKDKPRAPRRDPNNYAFSIFGTPDAKGTWGWRVEGHHLSVNITVSGGHAVAGPVFFGSNPAEVRQGPRKGLRVLAKVEDLGFELINSMNDDQKKKVIVSGKAPNEIKTSNRVKADPGPQVGIPVGDMTGAQKLIVLALLEDYAHRLRPELAEDDLARIQKAGLDKVYFAWEGATQPGQGHYYRLHGPTFLVEFDNTQDNANHIHSVWRDSANDFGEDLLKQHYQADHPNPTR